MLLEKHENLDFKMVYFLILTVMKVQCVVMEEGALLPLLIIWV